MLGEQEQILLRRMAVFACSWTLYAAEEVCSGVGIEPAAVRTRLDALDRLWPHARARIDTLRHLDFGWSRPRRRR